MLNGLNVTDIKVAVLLLNWNGVELTLPCIDSLINGTVRPTKIFVVDNASIDCSVQKLGNTFSDIEVIENKENLGFTGGNNVGLERILSGNYDYVWILNNDTVVAENSLKYLLDAMEADLGIAAASGKILYDDPQNLIWYAGSRFNFWTLQAAHKGERHKDLMQYDLPEDVPFISGCCMFVRKSALEHVGLFDNNFFAYYEDYDWCLRAKSLGLRLRYVPDSVIYHKVSASFKKTSIQSCGGTSSPFVIYLITRNRMFIIRKHANNIFQFIVSATFYFTRNCFYAAALIFLFRIRKMNSIWKGTVDGCFSALTKTL